MKKNQIIVLFWATFFISFFLLSSALQAKKVKPLEKPSFQFLVFPDTVYTDSEIALSICLVNTGGGGQMIYEGSDSDHIVISFPIGSDPDDLINDAEPLTFYCSSQNPFWICEEGDITEDEISFIFHPDGTVYVMEGETVCFDIIPVNVNLEPGLSVLQIDQQIDKSRVNIVKNTGLSIMKTSDTVSVFPEADPTVDESVKDGVSWDEVTNIPADFADGTDDGIITETDPTVDESVKDGVSWDEVTNIPADFADGTDDGITTEADPTVDESVKDGVSWDEVTNIPADFADGTDDGITTETDPTIAESVKDGVSWDELINIPADFADGADDGITTENDPTVPASIKDGISWAEISNRPVGLDDGDNIGITIEIDPQFKASAASRIQNSDILNWNTAYIWGDHKSAGYLTSIPENIIEEGENISLLNNNIGYLTSETDPTVPANLKNGVSWSEIAGIPIGFADGIDDVIAEETDPKLASVMMNYIPKWDGSSLIDSISIFEDTQGNIGIGTTFPEEIFHIVDDYRAAVKCETFTDHNTRASTINFSKGRGNASAPEIILEDDVIGKVSFRAYDGVNFESAASFGAIIDGIPNDIVDGADMPGALFFSTTPAGYHKVVERMRINNQGNVGIGTTSPEYTLDVDGDIHYTGNIYDVSDIRLKENIKPIENAMEKVSAINGIYFTYIGQSDQEQEVGVIAQDVEIVLPEAVAEDNEGYKSVDYSKLTPLLIESVKELKALNEALVIKNTILEARLSALEERMTQLFIESQ